MAGTDVGAGVGAAPAGVLAAVAVPTAADDWVEAAADVAAGAEVGTADSATEAVGRVTTWVSLTTWVCTTACGVLVAAGAQAARNNARAAPDTSSGQRRVFTTILPQFPGTGAAQTAWAQAEIAPESAALAR